MWEHRNMFLHDTNSSLHPHEIITINKEIEYEHTQGLSLLPSSHTGLFSEGLLVLLGKTLPLKLNWLTTVWTLRELHNTSYFLDTNTIVDPLSRYRYLRWKQTLQ